MNTITPIEPLARKRATKATLLLALTYYPALNGFTLTINPTGRHANMYGLAYHGYPRHLGNASSTRAVMKYLVQAAKA